MKRVFLYLRPFIGRIIAGVSVKFLGTVMDLLIPYILSHIIDHVAPKNSVSQLVFWGVLMLVCSALAITGNITANWSASKVARSATAAIRRDLFTRIVYLSNAQVDRYTTPSLISRMTTDTYNIHRIIGMLQRLGIRAPILLLGGILMTLTLDPVLTGVLVAMLPLLSAIVYYRSKRGIPLFRSVQGITDRMLRVVREDAEGIRVIKALSRTDYEKTRFEQVNAEVRSAEELAQGKMAIVNPLLQLLLNLGLVFVVLVGAWRVSVGAIGVGAIIAYLSYFTIILNALLSVSRLITTYTTAAASGNRIAEVLDTPFDLRPIPTSGDPIPDAPEVEYSHVVFSYGKRRADLSDISFSLGRGETMGILGPTGSGKSTLAHLLIRFYDPDSGTIRIQGRDIRELETQDLRRQFGVVFQHDLLFDDTIAENIRLGRDLTDEQVEQAARCAQALDFILEKGGFDSHVNARGTNLSGGQKQRLLVARALAGRPAFLILDDASSALDYKTDAAMREAIRTEYADTTVFIIAQRVSSVMRCDKILVLEDGVSRGFGNHEALMEQCALYREIAELQMGGVDNAE